MPEIEQLQNRLAELVSEVNGLRIQNRELVTEIRIRDGIISDLQNKLAALEDENTTLRIYYKEWCQEHRPAAEV